MEKYYQDIGWYKEDFLNNSWSKKETEHYVFYFLDYLNNKINDISEQKERDYQKLKSFFKSNPETKIQYYIYADLRTKQELMGDNSPGNAIWKELDLFENDFKTTKFEIHVVYNDKCKFIGRHEDTHLISLNWGLSIYLLNEGLAQYLEGNFQGQELKRPKDSYKLKWLFDNNNWEQLDPKIIYPEAGSFVVFLIDKYGKKLFKEIYQTTSRKKDIKNNLKEFEKRVGNIDLLEKEWESVSSK